MEKNSEKHQEESNNPFSINDDADILSEILSRLDGRSLAVAACVCRLWSSVGRREDVWESVCLATDISSSYSTENSRAVVKALGGYRRLYRTCVGPVVDRLAEPVTEMSLSLSMSLFSIDCYERLWLSSPSNNKDNAATASSLLFLANNHVVNVA